MKNNHQNLCENKLLTCCNKFAPCSLTLLRILVGLVFVMAGYAKLQNPTMVIGMLQGMHFPMPEVMGWMLLLSEFICGILLVLGLMTRLATIPLIIAMSVAFFTAHLPKGFVGGAGVGTWYVSLLIVSLLVIATNGSKSMSLDSVICKFKSK